MDDEPMGFVGARREDSLLLRVTGENKTDLLSIYKQHYGKVICYRSGENAGQGVLQEVNFKEGYVILRPAIVPDVGFSVRLERKRDTVVPIDPRAGAPYVIPMLRDYLRKEIDYRNDKVREHESDSPNSKNKEHGEDLSSRVEKLRKMG